MKTIRLSTEKMFPHPYHEKVYQSGSSDSLTLSFRRTDNEPVYPIIVVPIVTEPDEPDLYWVVSGMKRLNTLIEMGSKEVEVTVREITDESDIRNLIIDLNKVRNKTGRELLMEFRHFLVMYADNRGKEGRRYPKIGVEMGMSEYMVKDFVILNKFFEGEGDVVLENIFGGVLSINQGMILKKVIEKYPEKFGDPKSFESLCDGSFDFNRLEYAVRNLNLEDEFEFELAKSYLNKDLSIVEFQKKLGQLGKTTENVGNHNNGKVDVPVVDLNYQSDHARLINGDNRVVLNSNPFERLINVCIGSAPYLNLRLNGEDKNEETGHNMTGREYGVYLAETYEKIKPYMAADGSIYVILDDTRNVNGSYSLYLEHFVIEMERNGFQLVGRYIFSKTNPQPRNYKVRSMVNGFEMIYRFSLNPSVCYFNPDMYIELDEHEIRFTKGCTNTDNKGNTSHGGSYCQSHLKKVRNTLNEQTCIDIIRGNVSNPEDYFRQEEEKRHTSTTPMYLTSVLILESTRPGDLVVDIWNGVGNTMESALLLQRDYVGIEKEEKYVRQSQRRLQMLEAENDFFNPEIQVAA